MIIKHGPQGMQSKLLGRICFQIKIKTGPIKAPESLVLIWVSQLFRIDAQWEMKLVYWQKSMSMYGSWFQLYYLCIEYGIDCIIWTYINLWQTLI